MPERFSWTLAAITLSCSWTAWLWTWTRSLNRVASMTSSGYGAIAHSVSDREITSIAISVPRNASVVPARLRPPKPTSCLTAAMSLVERDIRSPVRWAW